MNSNSNANGLELMPPLDSQAGLEARLLRLMEATLAEEQRNRCQQDLTLRPLSAAELRRSAIAELMLHAEDGYLDHMNGLVKRSAAYTAGILAFLLSALLWGQNSPAAAEELRPGNPGVAPARLQLMSSHNWNVE